MKILVTGANGYLGRGIVTALIEKGVNVVSTDINTDGCDERSQRIQCDIFTIDDPYNYFGKPDAVLHLAWRNGFEHNSVNHINDLPLHYSFLCKLLNGGLKRITVMGTMHEVGFYEGSIREDTPTNPQSLYGIAKDALRKMTFLEANRYGALSQWIRGYYIVGNAENGSSIFSKIVKAEKRGEKFFPFTMGKNQWDFLDYDVFCDQVASIVVQDKINGIINACSGYPERLADRVEKFLRENNFNIKLKYGVYPDRPYDSKALWGDDEKIIKILASYSNGELN